MMRAFSIGKKQSGHAGRTVREIVELAPEQVSEVWCRALLRHMLHVLERQHALRLPHRAISPDTIVFRDGAPLLLPVLAGDPMRDVADDLSALARTVHYAITREAVPAGPLLGRAPACYSASLIAAIDRSMAADPLKRPRTIGELRDILGIVAFRRTPPPSARTGSQLAPPAPVPTPSRPPIYLPRWTVAGGGAAVLAVAALAMAVRLHGPIAPDPVVAPPVPLDQGTATHPGPSTAAETDAAVTVAPILPLPAPAPPAISAMTPREPTRAKEGSARTPVRRPRLAAASTPVPDASPTGVGAAATSSAPAGSFEAPAAATPPHAAPAGAVFTLQIQPWGAVYVDGVKRGISPPVKQLVLAAGRHAILVTNPGARERVLEVDTARGDGRIAVDFESAPR